EVMDVNGDGFTDLVDTSALHDAHCPSGPTSWKVYLGSKAGFSGTPTLWSVPDGRIMCHIRESGSWGQSLTTQWTRFETLDIDGDGIADFLDASLPTWKIYFGAPNATASGWGFSTTPVLWTMPSAGTHWSATDATLDGHAGTADYVELRDMNGDGLIDLVRAP